MKKLLTTVFVLAVLACSVSSCGSGENSSAENSDSSVSDEISYAETNEPTNPPNDTGLPDEVIKPLLDYFKSYSDNDAELLLESTTPKFCLEWAKETDDIYNEAIESTKDTIASSIIIWQNNYGDDVVREFVEEVSNTTLTPEQLGYADMMMRYDYYGIISDDFEITEGYEVTFTYSLSGSKKQQTEQEKACLINIKNEGWLLLEQNAASLNDYKDVPPPEEVAKSTEESETTDETSAE